jgi:hypothetical protein
MAKINKMIIGLLVLIAGIVTIVVLPGWGKWLADYPGTISSSFIGSLPATSQAAAAGSLASINAVFTPLLEKLGDWIKLAGYGVGALLALLGICIALGGMMKSEAK